MGGVTANQVLGEHRRVVTRKKQQWASRHSSSGRREKVNLQNVVNGDQGVSSVLVHSPEVVDTSVKELQGL